MNPAPRTVHRVCLFYFQLVYEALLDEVVGIDAAMATVDTSVVYDEDPATASAVRKAPSVASPAAAAPKESIVVHLNSNERVYFDIRDASIETVSGRLNAKMRDIMALTDSVRKPPPCRTVTPH